MSFNFRLAHGDGKDDYSIAKNIRNSEYEQGYIAGVEEGETGWELCNEQNIALYENSRYFAKGYDVGYVDGIKKLNKKIKNGEFK